MRLACRLRELRLELGLSIRDMEAESGIDRAYLSQLERGRLLPRDEWIEAIEEAYGADRSSWYVPPAGAIAGVVIELDEQTDGITSLGV
jgi:transcriptional regulator with XRE-family HTH domain